jgi:hypothetical protein
MGDVHHRGSTSAQENTHVFEQSVMKFGIQASEWLIEQQNKWISHKCACNRNSFRFAT